MSYSYTGAIERVIDGDTVVIRVDLGFSVWMIHSFRLLGCNAREHTMPGGKEATANLETLLPVASVVGVSSVKNDKYMRYDAAITLADGRDLVTVLVDSQWASPWNGEGAKPIPPWPRTAPSP